MRNIELHTYLYHFMHFIFIML